MTRDTEAQGAKRLYSDAAEYVNAIAKPELITDKIPSIATKGRSPFSPVLVTKIGRAHV